MKNKLAAFIFYIFCIACAQKVAPSGGKKDIINPKLVSTFPKNQSLSFNENFVELLFDEYVKVENINQNLIITPNYEGTYSTKIKPKGAKLVFNKLFKPNTTYSLNFRNTFKDFSEGNLAKNIRLVFSTGKEIDSLKVSGKVTDPLINKPVFDALIGMYVFTDTLNIKKEKPYYFTKTDSLGRYTIENIKKGIYKIYSIVDNNNNTVFNELSEKIGYKSDTFNISKNIENVDFEVVKQDKNPLKVLKTRTTSYYANVEFNKGVKSAKVIFKGDSLPYMMASEKEIKIINTKALTDTIKYEVIAVDSVNKTYNFQQKFIYKKISKKTEAVKEEFKAIIEPKFGETIENNSNYVLTFNKPILKFNLKKVLFLEDTLKEVSINDSLFKWNENKNILTVSIKSKSKNVLRLSILKEAFFSVEGDTLKKIIQDNPIIQPDDTGILSGEIVNSRGTEIVQLLNEKFELVKEIKYQKKYLFKNIPPGKYLLRLIQDLNKNGEWDSGDVEKNVFPEKIQHITGIIQVKANFELSGYNFTIQ